MDLFLIVFPRGAAIAGLLPVDLLAVGRCESGNGSKKRSPLRCPDRPLIKPEDIEIKALCTGGDLALWGMFVVENTPASMIELGMLSPPLKDHGT